MGALTSSNRRSNQEQTASENESLVSDDPTSPSSSRSRSPASPVDEVPDAKDPIQKATDVLAALKAHKLPSQDQVNKALQLLLKSNVLNIGDVGGSGPVGDDTRNIQHDLKNLAEAIMEVGLEKNGKSQSQKYRPSPLYNL